MVQSGKAGGGPWLFGPNAAWYLRFSLPEGFGGPFYMEPRPFGPNQFVQAEGQGILTESDGSEFYLVLVRNLRNTPVQFEMWWIGGN